MFLIGKIKTTLRLIYCENGENLKRGMLSKDMDNLASYLDCCIQNRQIKYQS